MPVGPVKDFVNGQERPEADVHELPILDRSSDKTLRAKPTLICRRSQGQVRVRCGNLPLYALLVAPDLDHDVRVGGVFPHHVDRIRRIRG